MGPTVDRLMGGGGHNRWRCLVPDCSNAKSTHSHLTFFRFPKNEERCREWVKTLGLPELSHQKARDLHKRCCVCSMHFQDFHVTQDRKGRTTLVPDATPTLLQVSSPKQNMPTLINQQEIVNLEKEESDVPSAHQVLVVEPYFGGSHQQLLDLLSRKWPGALRIFSLPAKKWHWRARVSALHFAQILPKDHQCRVLLASSVLNLCELCALRPDLAALHKVLYFHENQLEYPVLEPKNRDFQYGYNQILSCLVADRVYFNSGYNMESFLGSVGRFLKRMPDFRPADPEPSIRAKSQVLYFPLDLRDTVGRMNIRDGPLHIVWPHRWEHDKNPQDFFWVLFQLQDLALDFRVSVLGEAFSEIPEIFAKAKEDLGDHIVSWGYLESYRRYLDVLQSADVVVSTSKHEFFGVAMLEAVSCGCYPLCPNRLVYPEIFPREYLYQTRKQLLKILKGFCRYPHLVRNHPIKMDVAAAYSWEALQEPYRQALLLKTTTE